MPPLKKGQRHFQFSIAQNEDGYKIAYVRGLVERAIKCMKGFQCLDFVQPEMCDHMDDALVIICGICNLYMT